MQDEIEAFRRKSYIEQFEDLEKRFGVNLTKFERWPDFVEATQRRNVFMHCNGIVSEQYISICKAHKVSSIKNIKIGDQLEFEDDYIISIMALMSEISVKLGHVLWRKIIPSEIEESDEHLHEIIYSYLRDEDWSKAIHLADFTLSLPEISNDLMKKINIMNAVIAYKFSGQIPQALTILDNTDWSSSISDFRLAEAILRDDYPNAADIMKRIGKEGELLKESGYHDWPLFKGFRESEDFLNAYEEIYGYTFLSELRRCAEERMQEAEEVKLADIKITEEN